MAKKLTHEFLRMLLPARTGLSTAATGMVPKTKKDVDDMLQLLGTIKVAITGRRESPRAPLPARPADKPIPTGVHWVAGNPRFVGVPLRHHSQVEPNASPSPSGLRIALRVGGAGGVAAAAATAAAAEVGPVSPSLLGATDMFVTDSLPRISRAVLAAASWSRMPR